jgi:hypothetical protein
VDWSLALRLVVAAILAGLLIGAIVYGAVAVHCRGDICGL